MKALSFQQPWASLIAHGIKDVENRTRKMLVPPQRILIHASAAVNSWDIWDLPDCWAVPIFNAETLGQFDHNDTPRSAIIGYVDVVDIIDDSDSRWASFAPEGEKPMLHYVLKNARLFKEPIYNVKGRLGVWDYPDIDENNLPETIDIPQIHRDGTTLYVPCGEKFWTSVDEICNTPEGYPEIYFQLYDRNMEFFTDADLKPIATSKLVLSHNGMTREIEIDYIEVEDLLDEDGNTIPYYDMQGREYVAKQIVYCIASKN